MPTSPENLAMFESDWPGAGWDRGKRAKLPGPCRGDELGARISSRLAKFHAPEIVFGPGALAELGHCRARTGARRPFLVTDPGLIEAGWVDEALAYLRQSELHPALWHAVTPNPEDHEIEAGFSWYEGVDKVVRPIPPTVMVPSTSGTGADVSQFAIVTDTAARNKITIISRTLVPEISVIDPRLLTTMPDWLNATTGLDALTHGIESFVSRANNPLTDRHALHAVALITRHLLRTQLRPTETASRLAMAQGSLEAGMAFTNAILGATHAMSHQGGGQLDAPHGVLNAVLLPHVIRFNVEASPKRFVPLAAACGIRTEGVPAAEVALLLADAVRKLADELGVPKGLAELGVTDDLVPRLARTTLKDACLATNPRAVSAPEIEALFRAAL